MFTITGSSNIHFLKFWHFNFSNFQTTFVKIFTKKPPSFKIDFESTDKVLPLHQYLWSEISRQWNNGPLNFFWNLHGRAFCCLNVFLRVVLMETKVSQVGCFQSTGRGICYSIFDISFIVFFTRLLSINSLINYPFYKMQYITEN